MKKTLLIATLTGIISLSGFTGNPEISKCFLSFKKAGDLIMQAPEQMPTENDRTRTFPTAKGDASVTIVDGYRIFYNNKKSAPFVNLKVELSEPKNYAADTTNVLENLSYMISGSPGMESGKLLTMKYSGFRIYGLSRKSLDAGTTLGIFAMFPGNNTIVYFYFNNLTADTRTFTTIEDYRVQRNDFIGQYTAHISNCKGR